MTNELALIVAAQFEPVFHNLSISMKTYDSNALICGTPAWRYVYHTLHSCDRWLINPEVFDEPAIHTHNLDKVDLPTDTALSEETLWLYFEQVRDKAIEYLRSLTDDELCKKPQGCEHTRMALILAQLRHFNIHIGILNGITIADTGRYPYVYGLTSWENADIGDKLFDE